MKEVPTLIPTEIYACIYIYMYVTIQYLNSIEYLYMNNVIALHMYFMLLDCNFINLYVETAEEWLKHEDEVAYEMRQAMITKHGSPGSKIRPEGTASYTSTICYY